MIKVDITSGTFFPILPEFSLHCSSAPYKGEWVVQRM